MTVSTRDLLSKGYFPRELPPPFTTETFGNMAGDLAGVRKQRSQPTRVNLARPGGLRRTLAIPNPEAQIRVATCIAENWAAMEEVLDRSKASRSRPIPGTIRALERSSDFSALPAERSARAYRARFTAITDVSQHYGSIYTHSIPWAVVGKTEEKRRFRAHESATFSNHLDEAVRNGQDKQTKGIPIGPDTSLVISELILSNVDADAASKHPGNESGFLRYMDDFHYYASTRSEAEEVLSVWESALAVYELQINPLKTHVIEGPPAIQPRWRTQLSQFRIRTSSDVATANDTREYMGFAFDLSEAFPTKPVLAYAISRAAGILPPSKDAWSGLLEMALAAVLLDPSALPYLSIALHRAGEVGVSVDEEALSHALNEVVHRHAPLQHGVEVSWALWILRRYEAHLAETTAFQVSTMTDNAAQLLVRDLLGVGLIEGKPDLGVIEERAVEASLQGGDWLLAYESAVREWIPSTAVNADPFFRQLKAAEVSFFDPDGALSRSPVLRGAETYS